MSKSKYVGEFELKASVRMLYPYISTASGLSEWFADNVNLDPRKNYIFFWNGEKKYAKRAAAKADVIRFEFMGPDGKPEKDPSYLEISLEENEMTNTTFLHIIDYSEFDSHDDMDEIYYNLVVGLKEIVGG